VTLVSRSCRRVVWTGCRCGFSPIWRIVGSLLPRCGNSYGHKNIKKNLKTSLDHVYFPLSRIPTTIPPLPLHDPPVKLTDTREPVFHSWCRLASVVYRIIQGDSFETWPGHSICTYGNNAILHFFLAFNYCFSQ